jgi:peptide/nickel transport system permease protein
MPPEAVASAAGVTPSGRWAQAWQQWAVKGRIFAEGRIGPVGVALLCAVALFAAVHPLLMLTVWDPQIYDPMTGFTPDTPLPSPPSWAHPLGLSRFGRDVMSQLMYSVRVAFGLGVLAASISISVGTVVGCLAAFYRDTFVDTFFMRLANFLMIFPTFTLLVALSGVAAIDLTRLALVIGLLGGLGGITVVLKSRALGVTVKPFVDAARISGGSDLHLLVRHVIPNVLPLSFLYMMFTVTSAIFAEASLSFFGLLPQVRMSLGLMINEAYTAGYLGGPLLARYWYLWVPPGLAITLLCAAFYLIGRGLDEVVNPRLRERA